MQHDITNVIKMNKFLFSCVSKKKSLSDIIQADSSYLKFCFDDSVSNIPTTTEEDCSVVVGNEHKNNGNIRHQPCNKLLYYEIVSFGGLNIRCPCHEFYDPQNVHKCKEYFSDQRGCIVYIGDSPYYIFIT